MPVIRLESPGSGLWSQMTWPQYPVIGLTHPCILRRDSCRAPPMNLVPLSPFLGRGNVGTPWRVRSKGAEYISANMASSSTLTKSRQAKRACTELETPNSDQSDSDSPSVNYDRWYIMQGAENDTSITRLSPFLLEKALKAAAGNLKTIKRLEKGDILLEVSSEVQSRCLLKLNNLAGCPVLVTPHKTMNISKGVIRCKDLLNCEKEEILVELKTQYVKDIYNISVKTDSGDRRKTNTFIVTFNIPSAPKFLKIGYIRVPVATYIPNPLRCFKCQKFGHGSRTCKNDTRCANIVVSPATIPATAMSNQNAATVPVPTPLPARNARSGYLRKKSSKSRLKGASPSQTPVRSLHLRIGLHPLREVSPWPL